jgi:hypothetical protein
VHVVVQTPSAAKTAGYHRDGFPHIMGVLDRIESLGGVAAENDDLLGEYFIRTTAYKRIVDQERFIVVGRKGTGKTAIYRELQQRAGASADCAAGLEFSDYPWGAHQEVANTLAAPVERFTESWRFLILVELAKLVLKEVNPRGRDARALRRFIKRNWGTIDFQVRRVFEPSQFEVEVAPQFLGFALGSLRRKRVERRELAGLLSARNDWLKTKIRAVVDRERRYFVLFDGLDIAYNAIDDDYKQRLIGLLLAARSVYTWGRDNSVVVAPVVFLRSDIYDALTFADQNKMTEDNVQLLMWDDGTTGENSLKALVDQRIRVATGSDDDSDPWGLVFDETAMRGTQPKYRYMVERTYLRPRDMIKFANVCLANAKAASHERITNDDIYNARPQYSDYVYEELDNEISAADPRWTKGLEVLREIRKMTFDRARFEEAFARRESELEGLTPDELLRLFYRFGIIGFVKKGGGGGGSEIAWQYRDPKQRFDAGAKNFRVHWSLKEYLDLVE